jgi:cytochrome c-type biogenesis protein CcmF
VENASFMPWLVGTALMHSLAVTEKRGVFRSWTLLLAIGAFSLSLLGTFLVRSGVLTSVHAFASDPRRGVFILLLLALFVGASLALFAARAPRAAASERLAAVSRESMLLVATLVMVVACASVLLGTLYPLVIDALGMGKLSVGPPYFNAVFVPVMVPALVLMVVAPFASWRSARLAQVLRERRWTAAAAVAGAVAVPFAMGQWMATAALGSALALGIAASVVEQSIARARAARPPLSFWGMQLAHMGIAVCIAGITMVVSYQQEKDVRMEPGDTVAVGGYTFRLVGVKEVRGPNYTAQRGEFDVSRGAQPGVTLRPEKRNYFSSSMPMTNAAIDAGLTRDLYVSLGEPLGGGAWAVRVYYKPFVDWIWAGGFLMALGGVLSAIHRRHRRVAAAAPRRVELAASAAAGGAA